MRRCSLCHGLIWPWQNIGHRITDEGTYYWHPRCQRAFRRYLEMVAEEEAAYWERALPRGGV